MLLLEEMIYRAKRGLGFDKHSVFRLWFAYLWLRSHAVTDYHEIWNQRTKMERRIYLYLNLHMYNDILFPSRFKIDPRNVPNSVVRFGIVFETPFWRFVVLTDIKKFIETLFTIPLLF